MPSYLQRKPSHRSTRGLWTAPGYALSGIDPTATHQLDDLHDTANNSPYGNPGTRTCSTDQPDATASPLPNHNPTNTHTTTATPAPTRLATLLDETPPAPATGSNASAPHRRPTRSDTPPNTRTPPILKTSHSRLYSPTHPLATRRNSAQAGHRHPPQLRLHTQRETDGPSPTSRSVGRPPTSRVVPRLRAAPCTRRRASLTFAVARPRVSWHHFADVAAMAGRREPQEPRSRLERVSSAALAAGRWIV